MIQKLIRLFSSPPNPLEAFYNELDLIEKHIRSLAFPTVRPIVEKDFESDSARMIDAIKSPPFFTPRSITCSKLLNACGDLLETGNFHIYRGVLGIHGEQILKLYKDVFQYGIASGMATKEGAEEHTRVYCCEPEAWLAPG